MNKKEFSGIYYHDIVILKTFMFEVDGKGQVNPFFSLFLEFYKNFRIYNDYNFF